jgi:hypothetical protein
MEIKTKQKAIYCASLAANLLYGSYSNRIPDTKVMKILALKTTAMYPLSMFLTEMHTNAATILTHSTVTQKRKQVASTRT